MFSFLLCEILDCAGSIMHIRWWKFWSVLHSSVVRGTFPSFIFQTSVFDRLRTHILASEPNLSYVLLSRSWDSGKDVSRVGAPRSASSFTRPSGDWSSWHSSVSSIQIQRFLLEFNHILCAVSRWLAKSHSYFNSLSCYFLSRVNLLRSAWLVHFLVPYDQSGEAFWACTFFLSSELLSSYGQACQGLTWLCQKGVISHQWLLL